MTAKIAKTADPKPPKNKNRKSCTARSRWRRRAMVVAVLAIGALVAGWFHFRGQPATDLNAHLESLGFTANPGLDATFVPGTVIQVAEADGLGGSVALRRPLVFLRGAECFPDLEPMVNVLPLPERSGRRTGNLELEGKDLARFLPELRLGGTGVKRYSLAVVRPRLLTFAKAELSEHFSSACVEEFATALAAGDRAEWFETIIEAVVADGLSITLQWEARTSGEARVEISKKTSEAMASSTTDVSTELDSHDTTVLQAEGTLVLGYRSRPMEPVEEEP